MASGTVGNSGRATRAVAPNSPREIMKAKVAATRTPRPTSGRSILRMTWRGGAPSAAAACLSRGRMLRRAGDRAANEKRKGDQRGGQGDQDRRRSQVERRAAEGENEAEPEAHRRGAERKHEDGVDQPAGETASMPGERPRRGQPEAERQGDGRRGVDEGDPDRGGGRGGEAREAGV